MLRFGFLETESDFESMKELLRDNYRSGESPFPGPCDLEYWRFIYDESPELVRNAFLWKEDGDRLAAFAWMNADGTDYAVRCGLDSLVPELLSWAEETRRAGDLLGESLDFNRIEIGAENAARIATAERLGYKRTGSRTAVFVRDMDGESTAGAPPSGILIRSLEPRDLEARCRLAAIAQDMEADPANYARLMSEAALYDRQLDLIAEADGEPVAFCTGWADPATGLALIEPFGCRAEYRGRGIARAVVAECLARLGARGMSRVYSSHGGMGPGELEDDATRFNLSMGFHEVESSLEMVKKG